MRYCSHCGHAVELRIPPGDHLLRHVCDNCGTVHYDNPKVIVGCVPEWEDGRILLCRRAIEPRLGLWTFPAGFLELGETTGEGAARETLEESLADVEVRDLFAVFNVPYVNQVTMIYRGRMRSERHGPTPESSETRLVHEADVPWGEIAFPTIYHSLRFFFADRARGVTGFHTMDLSARPPRAKQAEVAIPQPD
jgi:ADP-ribose pyrophosphatase YjhB (NUDIX family)